MADLMTVYETAHRLMAEHGLTDWTFEWNSHEDHRGLTDYATKTILLSAPLIKYGDDHDAVMTILHEIAHALCPPEEGHGPVWRETCLSIGGDGNVQYTLTPDPRVQIGTMVELGGHIGEVVSIRRDRYGVLFADQRQGRVLFPWATIVDDYDGPRPTQLRSQLLGQFRPGQEVVINEPGSEVHGRRGTVVKVNRRTVRVDIGDDRCRECPPALLSVA